MTSDGRFYGIPRHTSHGTYIDPIGSRGNHTVSLGVLMRGSDEDLASNAGKIHVLLV